MYKIAICGKANTGKNTLSKMIKNQLRLSAHETSSMAFADPIKEMIRIMFPSIPRKYLYGSSKWRNEVVPEVFKEGKPLTIRQLLIDIGTGLGRGYKETVWLDNFDLRLKKVLKNKRNKMIIVTDVRFRNEFNHLQNQGFYMIRLLRDNDSPKINHVSETNQESILDEEFDYVVDNNSSLKSLQGKVSEIIKQMKNK